MKIVKLNDWHVPFHDPDAINAALRFCKEVQPDEIVLDELHDFYSLSRFNKEPSRIASLQEELDEVGIYLKQLRRENPNANIRLLDSNHLARLRKYIWANAQAFYGLRSLEITNLLELADYNITFQDSWEVRGRFLFKHGDIVRKHSAYTCRGEIEREGMSGMSGHTHRLGQHYVSQRGGEYVWSEAGCLCDLSPEYISGRPNWQHGIGLVEFYGNTRTFYSQVIPIINNEVVLYGQ